MDLWQKVAFPVRRVWFAVSTRVKARKNGVGLLKLHDDIQTCGYEDVQVMWKMLSKTDSDPMSNRRPKRKQQRPFWRIFVWSNHGGSTASFSTTTHGVLQ